jgi:hypothetical protein
LADIIFDQPPNQVNVVCDNLLIQGHDVMVDSASRRKPGSVTGFRRALVHNQSDGLTINFNGDYPDGVTINGEITFTIHHPRNLALLHQLPDEVVQLGAIIISLRAQIAELQAEVAALKK